jgi:hypothetical protein
MGLLTILYNVVFDFLTKMLNNIYILSISIFISRCKATVINPYLHYCAGGLIIETYSTHKYFKLDGLNLK